LSGYLLDTNVISELRKGRRMNRHVRAWIESVDAGELYLSVLVVGEIRRGIERVRRRDAVSAEALDRWLVTVERDFDDRILILDRQVAEQWGRLDAVGPLGAVDGMLAATALVHDLALVTRSGRDARRSGARWLDPFAATPART